MDTRDAFKEFFRNLGIAFFYPFGCFKLIIICSRNKLGGHKQFLIYSLAGFASWGFIARSFFETGISKFALVTIGAILYVIFLILFVRLCYAKSDELEHKKSTQVSKFCEDA